MPSGASSPASFDRLHRAEAAPVVVQADVDVRPDPLAHGAHAGDRSADHLRLAHSAVVRRLRAELERPEPARHHRGRGDRRIGVVPLQTGVQAHPVTGRSAQQAKHGCPQPLAGDVPQGVLDGAERRQLGGAQRIAQAAVDALPVAGDGGRILADQRPGELAHARGDRLVQAVEPLAQAAQSSVGLHHHEHVVAAHHDVGALAHGHGADPLYAHDRSRLLDIASRSFRASCILYRFRRRR